MKSFTITLTENELAVVRQCLEVAVKQVNMAGARAIISVDYKIEEQVKAQSQSEPA